MSTNQLASSLGLAASAVKTLLYRMRQRYGELLRDEVAKTLTDPNDVDTEISYLCSII
jgi:RNA polymerase sigma-70 factor (ECF subfamily)